MVFKLEDIKKNFSFRLITQNRLGGKQNIIFPISLLKILFYNSERDTYIPRQQNKNSKGKKEFDEMIDKMIDNIYLPVENDYVQVKDITEMKISEECDVFVKVKELGYLQLYTRNENLNKREPMKAKNLNDFHIDHQPLISEHLEHNVDKYNGLRELTKIINQIKGKKKLNTSNCRTIFSKALITKFDPIKELIPKLKIDLNDISNMRLEIMYSKYNLKKK